MLDAAVAYVDHCRCSFMIRLASRCTWVDMLSKRRDGGKGHNDCKRAHDEFLNGITCIYLLSQQRKEYTNEGSTSQAHMPKMLQTIHA